MCSRGPLGKDGSQRTRRIYLQRGPDRHSAIPKKTGRKDSSRSTEGPTDTGYRTPDQKMPRFRERAPRTGKQSPFPHTPGVHVGLGQGQDREQDSSASTRYQR